MVVGRRNVVAEARKPALDAGQVIVLDARLVADARGAGLERGEALVIAEAAVVGARVGGRSRGGHAGTVHIVQGTTVGGTRRERGDGEECRLCKVWSACCRSACATVQ